MENRELTDSEKNDGPAAGNVLNYQGPAATKRPSKLTIDQIGWLMLIVASIVSTCAGIFGGTIGKTVAVIVIAGAAGALFYLLMRDAKRTDGDEEDDERAFKERTKQRELLVESARRTYSQRGPIGRWRDAAVEVRARNMTALVHEERLITFNTDGTGEYIWAKGLGSDIEAHGHFEFRMVDGQLQVRVKAPTPTLWCNIEWGFEMEDRAFGLELVLWFESTNPLPLDEKDFWPFWGDFERQAMPQDS